MRGVLLRDDEARLRGEFVRYPEYEAADWATQSLSVVIARTGAAGWPNRSREDYRRRAIVFLVIRILRAARAGMAVHAAGWEVEARSMDRLLIESRARLIQVSDDDNDETGREYLAGELHDSSRIADAIAASAPQIEEPMMRDLYRALSQDSHADAHGITRSLVTVNEEDVSGELRWGPALTIAARQSLVMYATLAAETATFLAGDAQVEHPDRDALARRVEQAQDSLWEAMGEG